jgi:hypothetical protein
MSLQLKAIHLPSGSDIFLCHSSVDKDFVRRLSGHLTRLGVRVWLDEWQVLPGQSLHDSIGSGLADCKYVGVVISPDSVASDWCKKELHQALAQERIRPDSVVPLLWREADMPPFLLDKVYVDFRNEYYVGVARLAGLILRADPRDLSERLSTKPGCVDDVQKVLAELGVSSMRPVGRRAWLTLEKALTDVGVVLDKPEKGFWVDVPGKGRQGRC